MEKSFCHDLQHRIMIHTYDTVQPTGMGMVEIPVEFAKAICLHIKSISKSVSNGKKHIRKSYWYAIMTLLNVCILLLSHGKELLLLVISDTSNTETPKKEKKTYTVEEIAEQLCVSKKVAYALVKSGQFAYVRAGRAIRVSKDSFDKWLNQN